MSKKLSTENSNAETAIAQATAVQTSNTLANSAKSFPSDWEEQIPKIIGGMRQSKLDLGEERTADGLQLRMDELNELDKRINETEANLADMRIIRARKRAEIWQLASGIRSAVSGIYGKDSSEYQAVGGTRLSERKRPVRKPKQQ